ncbi:hypothetical protein [Nocardia sp. NPDC057030]|uniref:hypothetical protein n=1 Tax=unclassified Nocardia TaxID=2637762 RepID=UPI00362884C0
MPAPAGTYTAFRLARIAALVGGSLLFLYACENSKSAMLADKWVEVAIAGGLLAAGLGVAWFEVRLIDYPGHDEDDEPERAPVRSRRAEEVRPVARRDRAGQALDLVRKSRWMSNLLGADDEPAADRGAVREFLVESEGWSMRAKIARSGDLIFHGHDLGGTYPAYEWMWVFHPDTFPAIREALGDDEGEILDLLEAVVPQLDRHGRHDPGAWLRAHDIPATYREKGVSATQQTREIPVLRPGLPRPTPRRAEPLSARSRRNELPSKRSRRELRDAETRDEESSPIPAVPARSRRDPAPSGRSRHSDPVPAQSSYDEPEPARSRRDSRSRRSGYDDAEPAPAQRDPLSRRFRYDEPEPAPAERDSVAPSRFRRTDAEPIRSGYEDAEQQRPVRGPIAPSGYADSELSRTPIVDLESARVQWPSAEPARSSADSVAATRSPYDEPAPAWAPRDVPESGRAPQDYAPARSSYEDFGAARPAYPEPARPQWEHDPAPHYAEPAPHWPVRDDNARPPLERRRRSAAAERPGHDEFAPAPQEDPAEVWARRQRLDAIQAQLEQRSPEPPPSRRETTPPHNNSYLGDPDLPRQRRGSSAVPHDYPEASRLERLSPPRQRPEPTAGPSWPERSMPRQRQAPPPPRQRDDYTRSWDDEPDEYNPPARRRPRSSPPPDPTGSGRHASSHSATPPWP